uniref:Carrier domain-containing protein n=1 Tax=Cyprinus carpio TaxID=7962 RepID=A0A8C1UHN4_CYPCA
MDEDIAIIGIGCNFPGGEGVDSFWKVLVEGRNCVEQIPDERFDTDEVKEFLFLRFNEFDYKFFGINEAEADYMDPQQKLLLQCAYRALEDAGIPLEKVSGTRTGVYIGLMNRDYETTLNNCPSTITHYNGTGTAMSVAANRISFVFNLTGPSFSIDSACSSSLVGLHSACQAIKQGDCEMALCGGVSCILEPRVFVALSKAKMISPEGTSKPFCHTADGYGRGEGCGIVLLKPLKKALEDFDHIWGIVKKTVVNQDGHTVTPITKPSMTQQEALLSMIYSSENYLANVQYVEAHGTGTPAGDPVEARSISKIIAKARPSSSGPLFIGSVKSNIGHTESAAGVAGLIKILLMMKHETIVPSVFYSAENSSIDAKSLNLKIPTRAEKWLYSGSMVRMAGLNSFGFGGTNAHAIISEYVQATVSDSHTLEPLKLLPMSAATDQSLQLCIADTYQRISADETVDLQALAYTAACRRSHISHKFRKVFAASSVSELKSLLKASMNKKLAPTKQDLKLVFVFFGNGITYRGMCKQLLREEPAFRVKVKEVENYFQKFRCTSILQKIANCYDDEDITKPNVVQPLLFAIQVAIAHLLKNWGIRPDIVLGHSVGEVAAAHCSGLLSLEDAVKVVYHRSMLQTKVMGGRMLVVGNVPVPDVLEILPTYTGKICLAAVNSPISCVLSGDKEAVDNVHQNLQSMFKSKNLFLHVLDVPAAYHSHMMDPILGQIKDSIGHLTLNEKECELFSTVTGEMCHQGDFVTGEYWARNIRKPVAFEQAIKSVSNHTRNIVFVEIGPRRALQRNIMEILGNDTTVLPSVHPDKDHETMFTAVSKLFKLGVNVKWDEFYKGFEMELVILQCALPKTKQQQRLGIFSTVHDSALFNLLTLIASRSGWSVFTESEISGLVQNTKQCLLFVILPPYDCSILTEIVSAVNANHIIAVRGIREQWYSTIDVMQRDSERTYFQTLEMSKIFQKSRLKAYGARLQKWLKGMHLHKACPLIQRMPSQSAEHSGSYFNARTLDLIALASDDSTSNESAIPLLSRTKQLFSKRGVYIVTGGLSGLGFETVKFIAHRSGGCIATLSRSAPSEKVQEDISSLQRRYGIRILTLQCDVSVSEQVMEAITVIGKHFSSYPVRGVFHSAAVLHDGLLETLDRSLFQKVLQPKVCDALNLHFATLHRQTLDYFVCYSSISSFIGNAAQANYAAANSFLDAFCHFRRNIGLAGQSINWGPLKLGLLMDKDNFQKFLETKGLMIMDVSEIHEALENCLLDNYPQQVVCKFNFRNLKNHVLSQNVSLKFRLSALVEEGLKNKVVEDSRLNVQLSVGDCVRQILNEICCVDTDDLSDETALTALGIDSMLAMTLQNRLFQEIGVNIPLVALLDPNSTLSSLTEFVKQNTDEGSEISVNL